MKRVGFSQNQSRKSKATTMTDFGMPKIEPSTAEIRPGAGVPPSTGRIAKATPPKIDQVASVTMNGCSPVRAMIRPVEHPRRIASTTTREQLGDHRRPARVQVRRDQRRDEADHAADREIDAAREHHERLSERDEGERHDQSETGVDRAGAADQLRLEQVDREPETRARRRTA